MTTTGNIVCDLGTGYMKTGFAGQNFPTSTFANVIGRPILRSDKLPSGQRIPDLVVGEDCQEIRAMLDLSFPLSNGIVQKWDELEILFDHAFKKKLHIDPKGSNILLSEPPFNPKKNRGRLYEMMFEKFGFAGSYVALQGVLTLYAQGETTGIVVDAGDGVTHAIPVYDGFGLPMACKRLDVAGRTVTEYLMKLLQRRGYNFNRSADMDTVAQVKERFCYVATDFDLERRLAFETTVLEKNYTLPDGRVMRIGTERFEAPEAMFNPSLLEMESDGVSMMVYNAINAASIDVRSGLYSNIVLSGGSTMYPGFSTRLFNDIRSTFVEKNLGGNKAKLAGSKFKLNVNDNPRRRHLVFQGAAFLAGALSDEQWVTKQDWAEGGIEYTYKKCPQ